MKPAAFDYVRAESVAHAAQILAGAGSDGKVIAGGQSLMPMMNFRLVKPSVLVDINAIAGLDHVELNGSRLRIGALVRHFMTACDPIIAQHAPIVTEAMKHVAHLTVRNRGTFCGSVCHADPAAEMPMMTVLLDGRIHAVSTRGMRIIPIGEFFAGSLVTSLEPDELVTTVDLATTGREMGYGFHEFARRHGDYALAAVAVLMRREAGKARDVRIAVMGVGEMPSRVPAAEEVIEGNELCDAAILRATESLRTAISPNSDLNASADYRRHLAGALAGRAIRDAWSRAREAVPA
ncbi:xanthine dehydrogenase family protein subunit M [Bosea sp. (in: a-proteobacteria)]|jgi:carbon-monoxide dehydrogenase medium subunit|uniref:FAD binding domain-containing protein n=1 Tax=Bosea sp. (in: a-proteobacteria) TaxID=1871050 RepID=UPI002DDCFF5F|nr:xanthine dehydrogenase family protein subunit M [Bosea sp. (in: a-proteobacteria)]HEV2510336.1 xanthine dehydrogenase family protein subunit M [Bosea sp. (in: a-proteobacteria)]